MPSCVLDHSPPATYPAILSSEAWNHRMRLAIAGAIAHAAITGLTLISITTGNVFAAGQTAATPERPVPDWLRAVSMYAPASSAPNNILLDVPANGTIYPPDLITP